MKNPLYISEGVLMNKIKIENLSKIYQLKNGKEFYALSNIYLSFPNTGLISIVGKSGSGKSTLLNMIALLDTPSKGNIFINNKRVGKQTNKSKLYKSKIGILFQNYNLIDDLSGYDNVALPLRINGYRKGKTIAIVEKALKFVDIKIDKSKLKASKLSGGEKQRIALARAIVNSPEILLCDEPTGALDQNNSIKVMNILKKISEKRLVIIVSHNLQLVNTFSDRIISISNGKIAYDKKINDIKDNTLNVNNRHKKSSFWSDKIVTNNYKKRFTRHIFSICSSIVGITTVLITAGFYFGKDKAINERCQKQFDYGVGTLSKEESVSGNSLLKLTKTTRPTLEETYNEKLIVENYIISYNFDAILYQNLNIFYDEVLIENLSMNPIYSFDDQLVDSNLISKGSLPNEISKYEIVINQKCYSYLRSLLHKDPLNEKLLIRFAFESTYVDFDEIEIKDELIFEHEFIIKGVVNEIDYLQTNKIYYSYSQFEEYLSNNILPNLSTYFNYDINWMTRIIESDNSSSLSSYSLRLFPNRLNRFKLILSNNNLVFSSPSLLIEESIIGFAQTIEYTVFIFLIISVIGVVLIIGISSFANYADDKKISAILTCAGASKNEISGIYISETLISTFIALIISFPLSIFGQKVLNQIIESKIDIPQMINIPIKSFNGVPLLLPIVIFCITCLISLVITLVPISFSKRNNLKEELQSL